jgi:exosome complex component RRP45
VYPSRAEGKTIAVASTHLLTLAQVWHLRLTLHFLADAGNMLDCACLAGIVALKHFRRPEVEVIGDDVIIVRPFPDSACVRQVR